MLATGMLAAVRPATLGPGTIVLACAMADTLENRIADLEYLLAHLPEDLDARFAGVDTKLAELRELMLLQNGRFTKLEGRLAEVARLVDTRASAVNEKLDQVLQRLPENPA